MGEALVQSRATHAVARSPVMVPRAQVAVRRHLEVLTVDLDPAPLAAEAVIAGDAAEGPAADDRSRAEIPEDRALAVEPGEVEPHALVVLAECQPPFPERRHHLEGDGAHRYRRPVRA